MVTREYSLN
uniref:Uncharacterized protein n=1 Tax=Rhizophora mucronata TaxID=61149 RepID=A0A2P2QC85_RHIMU